MKRSCGILVFLLLLTGIINFEHLSGWLTLRLSDGRTPSKEAVEKSGTGVREATQNDSRNSVHGMANSTLLSPSKISDETTLLPGAQNRVTDLSIKGEISPIHFIRSKEILGSSKPSNENKARLDQAIALVANSLEPSALIVDADARGQTGVPYLLFIREEYNLTATVKSVYHASLGKSTQISEVR